MQNVSKLKWHSQQTIDLNIHSRRQTFVHAKCTNTTAKLFVRDLPFTLQLFCIANRIKRKETSAFRLEILTTWQIVCVFVRFVIISNGLLLNECELSGVRSFHSMEMRDPGMLDEYFCLAICFFIICRHQHFILFLHLRYLCVWEWVVCLNVQSLLSTVLIYYLPYLCLSNQISNSNHMYNNSISCMLAITLCNCTVYANAAERKREREIEQRVHANCQHEYASAKAPSSS